MKFGKNKTTIIIIVIAISVVIVTLLVENIFSEKHNDHYVEHFGSINSINTDPVPVTEQFVFENSPKGITSIFTLNQYGRLWIQYTVVKRPFDLSSNVLTDKNRNKEYKVIRHPNQSYFAFDDTPMTLGTFSLDSTGNLLEHHVISPKLGFILDVSGLLLRIIASENTDMIDQTYKIKIKP